MPARQVHLWAYHARPKPGQGLRRLHIEYEVSMLNEAQNESFRAFSVTSSIDLP